MSKFDWDYIKDNSVTYLCVFLVFWALASIYKNDNRKDAIIKTPLDVCIESLKLAAERNDKNFRLSCRFEGFGIEAGQIDAPIEMPELMEDL